MVSLPEKGITPFQIVDVVNNWFPKFDPFTGKPSKTEKEKQIRFHAILLGTKNPDKDNEPYSVTFFTRPVKQMVWTSPNGKSNKSSIYNLLRRMGFFVDGMDEMSSSDINEEAMKGAYGLGELKYKETDKGELIPYIDVKTIEPPSNEDHKETNKAVMKELFKSAVSK